MPTDTKLKELIINELTEEQYKAITPNDDELYLTPDGSITKNENGSYVLDGDVDITGTTKLNGGIKPIHIYKFRLKNHQYELHVYEEKAWSSGNWYNFFGLLIDEYLRDVKKSYCVGSYYINYNGNFTDLSIVSSWQSDIYKEKFDIKNGTYNKFNFATMSDIPNISNLQPKLYRHKLLLNNLYALTYDSTSNINVDSVTDLRTIMHISSTNDKEILPVCASDATAIVTLVVTNSSCQVDGTDVTTASDVVTTL